MSTSAGGAGKKGRKNEERRNGRAQEVGSKGGWVGAQARAQQIDNPPHSMRLRWAQCQRQVSARSARAPDRNTA
jgi:hypothetical protein